MTARTSPDIVSMIAALTDHRDVDVLETSLLRTVAQLLTPAWAMIFHLDRNGTPEFALAYRDGSISHDPGDLRFTELIEAPSVTAFPILSQASQVLGYLLVKHDHGLSSDEQRLLTSMFRIYDNYLTVLRESQIDHLTGLLNRNTFDAQLGRALGMIRRAYREETGTTGPAQRKRLDQSGGFWLGEIDIDHFKQINDGFGHLYGDEVLLIVANILRNSFRKTDLIYRFGGEEFVAIVFVENRAAAEASFERLRRAVESHAFPQIGRVTVSVGVTPISDTSIPVELLGQADQALYHAKSHGRNQVCFYDALVSSRQIVPAAHGDDFTLFAGP